MQFAAQIFTSLKLRDLFAHRARKIKDFKGMMCKAVVVVPADPEFQRRVGARNRPDQRSQMLDDLVQRLRHRTRSQSESTS